MADLRTTLTRRVGPLPVWAWGAVGLTGVGIGLYLRARRPSVGIVGEPIAETGEGVVTPVDVTGRAPVSPFADVPTSEPFDFGSITFPEPPFAEPMFADCPDGFILDMFGRCVPDPSAIATPPVVGPDRDQILRDKLRRIARRLQVLRQGGVTPAERRKVRRLTERRRSIRERLTS